MAERSHVSIVELQQERIVSGKRVTKIFRKAALNPTHGARNSRPEQTGELVPIMDVSLIDQVEITNISGRIAGSASTGDVSVEQKVELKFLNKEILQAGITKVEFIPAMDIKNVRVDVTDSSKLPDGLCAPDSVDLLLFMDLTVSGGNAYFSSISTYSGSPKMNFVEKS